jgi:hypothetical protein
MTLMRILNRPVKIWQAAVVAATLALLAVTATTIAQTPSARTSIREKGFAIEPGQIERARVLCGQRDLALGGGAQLNDPKVMLVRDSYPWRERNEGPRGDDGWEVSVQNTANRTLRAIVYVTCG